MTDILQATRRWSSIWRGPNGRSLLVIGVGWGLLIGTRMVYPVLLPYLREAFKFDLAVAGLLLTILWLGSAIGQLPGGILADRYSERKILVFSLVVVTVSILVVVWSPTLVILFVFTGVMGLGHSLYPIARITILTEMYPKRIGSVLGVTMAIGDMAQTVLPPIAGFLALALFWQAGLGYLIPLYVVVSIGLWFTLPRDSASNESLPGVSLAFGRHILDEFRQPNLILMSFILFSYILVWQSFTGFYPTYLVEVKGLTTTVAGIIFSSFFAFGVAVKLVSGVAYDRIGLRGSLLLIMLGPLGGFVLLPIVDDFWAIVLVTAMVSTMLGSGTVTQSYLADTFSEEMRGTGLGIIRTSTATLGAIGPVIFGVIAERGYFDEGYLLLAGVVVAIIVLTIRMPTE